MAGEWDQLVREWLIDTGYCQSGGLANAEDGVVYAAGSAEGDAWSSVYAEDHDEKIINDDEKEETITVNEGSTILNAMNTMSGDLWMGKQKYKVVFGRKQMEFNDGAYDAIVCAKPKGGAWILKTNGGSFVIAIFDEEKGGSKNSASTGVFLLAE